MEKLRYLNKQFNQNERNNFNRWWKEQISIYGQEVDFYVNNTTLSGSNVLYGEEPGAGYSDPKQLIVYCNLNNDAWLFSKFGVVADADLTGVIHYEHFTEMYGVSSEPKVGDLIRLTEFGSDRLNFPRRRAVTYEITEVKDQFENNPIAGHYVWTWKARTFDFSGEPGSPDNGGNTGANDNDDLEDAGNENFNYPIDNPCSNDSVYGEY
jgi:hypothetical protein